MVEIVSGTFYSSGNRNKWVYEVFGGQKNSTTAEFRIKATPYYECQKVNGAWVSYSGGASTLTFSVDGTQKFSATQAKRDSQQWSGSTNWTNSHNTYDNTYEVPLKIGAYTIYVACSSPSQSRTGSATYVTTIPVYINLNGTMKAMDKAYINSNGSMKECTIYVRVGDTIKALN